jgi:3-phosphoshikimate 1-carboxyvinyltransferase
VPASKPETQRAILASTLADGVSRIANPLRCAETEAMHEACRTLGAEITDHAGYVEVRGVGGSIRPSRRVIRAGGSALVFRTMAALASVSPSPVVVTGDATVRRRVMAPLFTALRDLGAHVECICDDGNAPVVNWGRGLRGGVCELPGDVSSQFITAILYVAPFATEPVEINVTGELYSLPYIKQTLTSLRNAGIDVRTSSDYRSYRVTPSRYHPRDVIVEEDYTSASYLLAAAALYPGTSVLANVHRDSAQGEFAIVPILRRLGLRVRFDEATSSLVVENDYGRPRGTVEIDTRECPNIVPTLAAIGSYIDVSRRAAVLQLGGPPHLHVALRRRPADGVGEHVRRVRGRPAVVPRLLHRVRPGRHADERHA